MGRNYGYDLFSMKLESSPIEIAEMIFYRTISDCLIAFFSIVGFLCCTGGYALYSRKTRKGDYWSHSTGLAITTIVIIRFIWVYFSYKFNTMIGQVSEVNKKNQDTLDKWSSYDHSCSDEYSKFDVPARIESQEVIADNIFAAEAFLWVVMILFLCELFPVVCCFLYSAIKSCNRKKRDDRIKQYEMAAGINRDGEYDRD